MSTRTYYRGPDALVTNEILAWRDQDFAVRELRNVGRVRGDVDRLRPVRAATLAGGVVLAGAAWTTVGTPTAYAVGALALGVPATLAVASRMRTPHWELRATYRGLEVVIYAATDERVFNQVARALRRSMEDARSPDPRPGLAAA